MTLQRKIDSVTRAQPTIEGAGVHLHRAFGNGQLPTYDPFLLLDDFRADQPELYMAGFPWHPHRGIETITYMVEGEVEHGDSLGNSGVISAGDVQWMTAGSGIIHQEMPREGKGGRMGGFQLWANLPASHKMMAPRYQDIKSAQIPVVERKDGTRIKVICGKVDGTSGPVEDIIALPEYLDVVVPPGGTFSHVIPADRNVFAYFYTGTGKADPFPRQFQNHDLIHFGEGEEVTITAGEDGAGFLLVSGKPLAEPIAWAGPIVMNTQLEIQQAFAEYRNGTFIKK